MTRKYLSPGGSRQVCGRVLLVLRNYGSNGTSQYLDYLCNNLRSCGYEIHAVVYRQGGTGPISPMWDKIYHLEPLHRDAVSSCAGLLDRNIGKNLIDFVTDLCQREVFQMCLVNYVFLSRAITEIPNGVNTVILTIDVFTDRNLRVARAKGLDAASAPAPGKRLSASEEKEGLSRADLVVAITDSDAEFFRARLHLENVISIPHLPGLVSDVWPGLPGAGRPLCIGFIGSAHKPNATALLEFLARMTGVSGYELLVAGNVCRRLKDIELAAPVELLGHIRKPKDLYRRCHLIINPDMLESGLKIKCVEALAHGMPLVCTAPASAGLEANSRYHRSGSVLEFARVVTELIDCPDLLRDVHRESQALRERFYSRSGSQTPASLLDYFGLPRADL